MNRTWIRGLVLALIVAVLPTRPLNAGPPCQGDLDGDGVIAFADLLIVLTSWGPYTPCPPVIAADLDGNCMQVDVPACSALGGSYQGAGVACEPDPCT